MDHLSSEISVLSRAVAYPNLSGAAAHIGLSQPQLSRIVAKIEGELRVILLDRTARRKSGWTPVALKLAEAYQYAIRNLNGEFSRIIDATEPKHINAGTLEGLGIVASEFCRGIFKSTEVRMIDLHVYDLNQLEELFFKGELDLIFTSREPGKKKFKYQKIMGYQLLETVKHEKPLRAMSPFEYGSQAQAAQPADAATLISNSLAVRKHWIESYGASGTIPSSVKPRKDPKYKEREISVHLIGAEHLTPVFWSRII